jgi:hypothetical protein
MRVTVIAVALLALALPIAAKTLNVGPGAQYTDIQTALDAASSGDVVSVASGYYPVPAGVEIKADNVTLKGAGADRTILDGENKAYTVVKLGAKGVTVSGFTLENGSSHGAYVTDDNWGYIQNNVIAANMDRGILLGSGTPHAIIDHNTFANNKVSAIYAYTDNPKTKFTNNVVYENGRSIVTDSTMSHMTVKYNCFWGQSNDSEATRTSKTNFRADPLFVNSESDFHLQDGSSCLGKGEKESNIGALGTGANPAIEKPAKVASGAKYRVVIFANDEDLGEKVLGVIKAAGFAEDESYVTDEPNEDADIKYGAASEDDISAIHKLVSVLYDGDIEETNDFDSDDYDIFINLP